MLAGFGLLLCFVHSFAFPIHPVVISLSSPQSSRSHRIQSTSLQNSKYSTPDKDSKTWQTGKVFTKNNSANRRGERKDAWWMREEEANNPRILPKYNPKWLGSAVVDKTWKLADLKSEAMKRGLKSTGKKEELIERINTSRPSVTANLLSDEFFTAPRYIPVLKEDKASCYPDIYESPEDIVRLREMVNNGPLE